MHRQRCFSIYDHCMGSSRRILLLLISLLLVVSCGKSPPSGKILCVGFVPAEDVQQVIQNAQPIVEILQKQLHIEVQPFVATDYTGVVGALRASILRSPARCWKFSKEFAARTVSRPSSVFIRWS